MELLTGADQATAREFKSSDAEPRATKLVTTEQICAALETAAAAYELPVAFFARLIWQESRFRTDAVSRAGARGIAQFMPGTAAWRGLLDPLDPILSLHASADYLRELRRQFGNLGLAAAAYNGGSGRVQAWLKGRGGLPGETRQYVKIVTGAPADQWRKRQDAPGVQTTRIPVGLPCPALVAASAGRELETAQKMAPHVTGDSPRPDAEESSSESGWAVLLAGSFSRSKARAHSERLARKFRTVLNGRKPVIVSSRTSGRGKAKTSKVRIAETDRATAEKLCAQLRAGGTSCVVMRSS